MTSTQLEDQLRAAISLEAVNHGPHRRYNVLTDSWVMCSPGRTQRPWQGIQTSSVRAKETEPVHDDKCFLCPGNTRASGATNPQYSGVWVFTNDFPALRPQFPDAQACEVVAEVTGSVDRVGEGVAAELEGLGDLFQVQLCEGTCRVICYSPNHSGAMCIFDVEQLLAIINEWCQQCVELSSPPLSFRSVQIFENRGEGASSPHPHGQVWASRHVSGETELRQRAFAKYALHHEGRCSLCDYISREQTVRDQRIIYENEDWLAVVPFWAYWPFETMIVPKRHLGLLTQLIAAEKLTLASAFSTLTRAFEGFADKFPYSMGLVQQPLDDKSSLFHLHFVFFPPLVRPAVKKFRVGYEMFADPCRDFAPEDAATRLRLLIQEQATSLEGAASTSASS